MESKILNFPDAMKLAQILDKYVDIEASKSQSVIDFIDVLVGKISPQEYLVCVELFIGKLDGNKLPNGDELLKIIISGMKKNNLFLLIDSYRKIGTK